MIKCLYYNDSFTFDPQLRVVCYDSENPSEKTSEDLVINIVRNVNSPSFGKFRYTVEIDEDYAQNQPVITLRATDRDNVRHILQIELFRK